jgi:hypothetical protein
MVEFNDNQLSELSLYSDRIIDEIEDDLVFVVAVAQKRRLLISMIVEAYFW